jgi:hypothetical protein
MEEEHTRLVGDVDYLKLWAVLSFGFRLSFDSVCHNGGFLI